MTTSETVRRRPARSGCSGPLAIIPSASRVRELGALPHARGRRRTWIHAGDRGSAPTACRLCASACARRQSPASRASFVFACEANGAPERLPAAAVATAPGPLASRMDVRPRARPGSRQLGLTPRPFDLHAVRRDFPILQERVNGRPLVWLDNAATTQKPQAVIDRLAYFYEHENSNIHRAAHELAARATDAYEAARDKVRALPGRALGRAKSSSCAAPPRRSIWWRKSWGRAATSAQGDEIVVIASRAPRQHRALAAAGRRRRARGCGSCRSTTAARSCSTSTTAAERRGRGWSSFTQVSNALGTVDAGRGDRRAGPRASARACWSTARRRCRTCPSTCRRSTADFYVFSGHKVFAPDRHRRALRQAKSCSTTCRPGRAAAT